MYMWLVIIGLEILCLIHALKTGKPFIWIYILAFLPLAGVVAYLVVEVIPDLWRTAQVTGTVDAAARLMDPTKELRRRREEMAVCDTVQTRQAVAEESVRCGLYDEAIELYGRCLEGMYKDDPFLLQGLAQAQFGKKDYSAARETLDHVLKLHPRNREGENRLLLARVFEEMGENEAALEMYDVASRSFLGEEVRCRKAMLLKKMGRTEEAQGLFQTIIEKWKRAPGHVRQAQKEWAAIAQDNLARKA